jgi:hypothetical protein
VTGAPRLQADVVMAWFAESLRGRGDTARAPLETLARESDRLASLTGAADIAELTSLINRAAELRG